MLDPQVRSILDALPPRPPFSSLTPAEVRAQPVALAAAPEPVGSVMQRAIVGPGGPLWLRIYRPLEDGTLPALIYMHGGGWVFGGLDATDRTCRALTNRARCVVISLAYRLSPETKFPGAVEDAYAVLRWTVATAAELKVDEHRVAIGGFSSGGNLAAAAVLMARDRGDPMVAAQLFVMPVADSRIDTPSWRAFENGPIWTRSDAKWSWGHYLARHEDGDHPYASILRAPDVRGLPPAIIVTAGCDPLRDEAERYGARLRDAGIAVAARRYEGMPHGFLGFPTLDATRRAFDDIALELRRFWARS